MKTFFFKVFSFLVLFMAITACSQEDQHKDYSYSKNQNAEIYILRNLIAKKNRHSLHKKQISINQLHDFSNPTTCLGSAIRTDTETQKKATIKIYQDSIIGQDIYIDDMISITGGGVPTGPLMAIYESAKKSLEELKTCVETNGNANPPLNEQIWERRNELNLTLPYNKDYDVLPSDIIGFKAGSIHNQIIVQVLKNVNPIQWALSSTNISLINDIAMALDSIEDLAMIPCPNFPAIYEFDNDFQHFIYSASDYSNVESIIDDCIQTLEQLPGNQWYPYLVSIGNIVQETAIEHSENPTTIFYCYLINSTLSVLYHSYHLWNLLIPDPFIRPTYIYNPHNGTFTIHNLQEYGYIQVLVEENYHDFILTPSFYPNGCIEWLFLFKELNPYTFDSLRNYIEEGTIALQGFSSYEAQLSTGIFPVSLSPDSCVYSIFTGREGIDYILN